MKIKLIKAYRILGVTPWASIEVVNAAKSAMIKKYHPDKAPEGMSKLSTEICKAINEAHSLIITHHKERIFDKKHFFKLLKKSGDINGSSS